MTDNKIEFHGDCPHCGKHVPYHCETREQYENCDNWHAANEWRSDWKGGPTYEQAAAELNRRRDSYDGHTLVILYQEYLLHELGAAKFEAWMARWDKELKDRRST